MDIHFAPQAPDDFNSQYETVSFEADSKCSIFLAAAPIFHPRNLIWSFDFLRNKSLCQSFCCLVIYTLGFRMTELC